MSLTKDFAAAIASKDYSFKKLNDFTLGVKGRNRDENYEYNFLLRIMQFHALEEADYYNDKGITKDRAKKTNIQIIPFSQLDPEVLEFHRNKLVELGGKPPKLTPEPVPERALPRDNVKTV